MAEGRKWRAGMHQAVEAKEEVEVTVATGQAARITVQDFFLRYPRLAGMTGTASSSAGELRQDLQAARRADSDQPPGDSPAAARARRSARPTPSGRRSSRKSSRCTPPAGRC